MYVWCGDADVDVLAEIVWLGLDFELVVVCGGKLGFADELVSSTDMHSQLLAAWAATSASLCGQVQDVCLNPNRVSLNLPACSVTHTASAWPLGVLFL